MIAQKDCAMDSKSPVLKSLTVLVLGAIGVFGTAQNIILPYNPDGNNDQLIGVSDLQDLLAIYGTEFSAAVVSKSSGAALLTSSFKTTLSIAVTKRYLDTEFSSR